MTPNCTYSWYRFGDQKPGTAIQKCSENGGVPCSVFDYNGTLCHALTDCPVVPNSTVCTKHVGGSTCEYLQPALDMDSTDTPISCNEFCAQKLGGQCVDGWIGSPEGSCTKSTAQGHGCNRQQD